jgi:gas vesicle protein
MKKNSVAKDMAIGAGIATVAAAIAGTYFVYGSKNAAKNRKKVKSWTLKAKGEILEQLENLSEINEEIYHKIVKEVSDKYQALKNIDKQDVSEFIEELKSHWKNIEKEIKRHNKKNKE